MRSPRSGRTTVVAMLGPASGRHLHALAHNRDPRPGAARAPATLDGCAARARAEADAPRRRSRRCSTSCSTAWPGGCVPRAGRRAHRRAPAPLRRLHQGHALVDAARSPPPTPSRCGARCATCSPTPARRSTRAGSPWSVSRSPTSPTPTPCSSGCPFDGGAGLAIDHTLDAVRDRFGGASIGRAALLGRARGWSMPVLPHDEPLSGP